MRKLRKISLTKFSGIIALNINNTCASYESDFCVLLVVQFMCSARSNCCDCNFMFCVIFFLCFRCFGNIFTDSFPTSPFVIYCSNHPFVFHYWSLYICILYTCDCIHVLLQLSWLCQSTKCSSSIVCKYCVKCICCQTVFRSKSLCQAL